MEGYIGWMVLRALILLLLMAIAPGRVLAADVAVVLSDNGGVYAEFAAAFQQYSGAAWRVRWQGDVTAFDTAVPRTDLIVAVGAEAARASLKRSDGLPVLATLLPRQAFERILAESGRPRGTATAIYLDQPLARLMHFAHFLLPDKGRVGILAGPDTRPLLLQLRQAAGQSALTAEVEEVDGDSALVPALGQLFTRSDFLLALPDSGVYRRDNIRVILLTSYRYQRPVVAFSQAFVTAGALAAVYSSPAQLARQAAEVIRPLKPEAIVLPPPQAPAYFSVAVNRHVAQSLGVSLPDEASLRRAVGADVEMR